jgi:hypothetical protein
MTKPSNRYLRMLEMEMLLSYRKGMKDYSISFRTAEAIKPGTPEAYGDQYVSIRSAPISVKIHNAIAFCI